MSFPRLLLVGNHSCGNRGDSAILRGLIDCLEELSPGIDLTVTSRFPTSSSHLLGRRLYPDLLHEWPYTAPIRPYRLKQWLTSHMTDILARSIKRGGRSRLLPQAVQRRIDEIAAYDAVVQVGGSFFVDLYGSRQYETPFCAMLADRPVYLMGHSLGPFATGKSHRLARMLLNHVRQAVLREPVSLSMLRDAELPLDRVSLASDTAWLVRHDRHVTDPALARWLDERSAGRPVIAITLRDLAPFDKRLGVSQQAFEEAFADLCKAAIDQGYDILALSMCTGIEGYRDDRMPALRVAARIGRPDHVHVVMDELNDLQVGQLLSSCAALVGTRLHSAIIAMNFGTPAIAINYEHKSKGIMQALGISELSADPGDLLNGSLTERALQLAGQRDRIYAQIAPAIARERGKARDAVATMLQDIGMSATHLSAGPPQASRS